MKVKRDRFLNLVTKKKGIVLSVLFIIFLMIAFLNTLNINQNFNQIYNEKEELFSKDLKTQALTTDNVFSGIGAPWNVTHYANRTKTDLAVSFYDNSFDDIHAKVELYGWNGYQLNSTITNLYDTRNWINGTFHAGPDDDDYTSDEDDSDYIANWTFHDGDTGTFNNPTTGNYHDTSSSYSNGQDCLELKVWDDPGNDGRYDVGDKCWWETSIEMDRGDVEDAWLSFSVRAYSTDEFNNHMVLQIIVNDKILWGNGLASMLEASGNPSPPGWGQWYNPYPIYLDGDDDQIFSEGVKTLNVTFEFKRVSGTAPGYEEYYTVLFDNVSLIVKSKVKPSQVELQLNNEDVEDTANYGEGNLGIMGNWNGSSQSYVTANFSSNLDWPLTYEEDGIWRSYKIELNANLNLFANNTSPETYYTADPDLSYQGSAFSVSNNSVTNWITYAHMEIPVGYEETNMTIEYPLDVNLTGVFFSQNPNNISQTTITEYGNKKVVNIPVSSITSNTNGFWKLTALSPNYCSELNMYKGPTATGPWIFDNAFISGEYINITGKIISPQLDISSYIENTKANMYIRFPDGTIWTGENQIKQVNDNGVVYFDPVMIPNNVPNYKAGEYELIITWNNSYSSFQLNETGIIYKKFTVIHDSKLEPVQGIYFIENIFDDRSINIKVSYSDLIDNKVIENADVYTNFTGTPEILSDIGSGDYLYVFNASKASAGNNTLTIYADHEFYLNKEVNIIVEVVKQTILTIENEYEIVNVAWNDNFTVKFNYTEKNTGYGIDAFDDVSVTWNGEYHLIQPIVGQYELECNTSAYSSLTLQSLLISINPYTYQAQSKLINVQITELGSYLKLYVNQIPTNYSDTIQIDLGEDINITVQYRDTLNGNHLPNAIVELLDVDFLNETNNQYTIIIGEESLEQGITPLTVFAHKDNYNAQSIYFFIRVTEKPTNFQLILNGAIKTSPAIFNLTIGEILNITVKYTDQIGAYIPNAFVTLNELSMTLTRDDVLKQHSIELDTMELVHSTELEISISNRISITANATNYGIQEKLLILTINKIPTLINISSQISAEPGDDVTLSAILLDTHFGGTILDAQVTYKWAYGQGELNDTNNNGIYEVLLENVPEGTYPITIYADAGDDYEFQSKEIALIVTSPEVGPGLDLSWLIYVLVGGIIGLVTVFTLYQKHYKYPPMVRKIRKLKKKVRKTKKTKPILVNSRDETIENSFQNNLRVLKDVNQTETLNQDEKLFLKKEEES
ncbi:MAG: hypothetical protein ACFFCL_00700 [Promethearchaeota archaeon]